MGTRGLNIVILNNNIKVAQYNQWDSYPGGQGLTALKFLRDLRNESFTEKVRQCSWILPEEAKAYWVECGADPESDMVSMDVASLFNERYYELSRDCGAEIYRLIQNSEAGLKLEDSYDFAGDSLFCEWAYVVDLDNNVFEVYKGFNQEPLDERSRFHSLVNSGTSQYQPVKLVKLYDLNELPSDDEFIAFFRESQDE